jgi:hypothetical protein
VFVGNCWAATESLTYGYLKRETGNTKEEEGDEVWYLFSMTSQYHVSRVTDVCSFCTYDPLEPKVVVYLGWLVNRSELEMLCQVRMQSTDVSKDIS